jgi:hypothetical protein
MPKSSDPRSSPRRRWKEAEARAVLDALARSGLSARAFARREGLKEERLLRWRRRLSGALRPLAAASLPPFVEIRPRETARVEVVLRSGRVLRCAEDIEAKKLRDLIAILEQDSAC